MLKDAMMNDSELSELRRRLVELSEAAVASKRLANQRTRHFIAATFAIALAANFASACKTHPSQARSTTPSFTESTFTRTNTFFTSLRIGMGEKEFNRHVGEHNLKDVSLLPFIGSLSDPNRHFFVSELGTDFTFVFDDHRRLVGWRPWGTGP
jgi:hypothetical protein